MKTRSALLVNLALAVLGLVAVSYFVALLAWQIIGIFTAGKWVALPAALVFTEHAFAFVPEFPWTAPAAVASVLGSVHLGLIPAVPGLALSALGALRVWRQLAMMRAEKQKREDRLRRVRDYRRDAAGVPAPDGRREPYIGSA